jgi:hypothetical protein
MNERPELRHVVAQWVSKAEEDLTAGESDAVPGWFPLRGCASDPAFRVL